MTFKSRQALTYRKSVIHGRVSAKQHNCKSYEKPFSICFLEQTMGGGLQWKIAA